jgi:hypothetical protein
MLNYFKMNILFRLSYFLLIIFSLSSVKGYGQFPPAAGQPGTTAMFMDSTAFIGWAKTCLVTRGYVNIADTTVLYNGHNKATYGLDDDALGKPDNFVVSLGDGGSAILTFENPIINGAGFDFAIFENSLDGAFLELGFVEVSSDGVNFFRFPATSYTQDTIQLATFGIINPTKINNFAGKYRVLFGTPFDLDTLTEISGLDVNHITHVKIIDVVGNILPPYASHDSQGNIVNDPWPTPFNTCGFDLDAVGVIHDVIQSVREQPGFKNIDLYPNPVSNFLTINIPEVTTFCFILTNITGIEINKIDNLHNNTTINLSSLPAGIYLGFFKFPDGTTESRKIIKL